MARKFSDRFVYIVETTFATIAIIVIASAFVALVWYGFNVFNGVI